MDEGLGKRIELKGMARDFSWKTPAAEYAKLYEAARAARGLSRGSGQSEEAAAGVSPPAQSSRTAVRNTEKPTQSSTQTPQGSGQAGRTGETCPPVPTDTPK